MRLKKVREYKKLSTLLMLNNPHLFNKQGAVRGRGQGKRSDRASILPPGVHCGIEQWFSNPAQEKVVKIDGSPHSQFPTHLGVALEFVFLGTAGPGPRF